MNDTYVVGAAFHGCLEPPPVHEVTFAEIGRGLVATRTIERGEIIFTESPLISAGKPPEGVNGCDFCMRSLCRVTDVPGLERLPRPDLWPTFEGAQECECGIWFCSDFCSKQGREAFHGRLCPAQHPVEAVAARDSFERSLDDHDAQIVRLVTRMMCMMLLDWHRTKQDTAAALRIFAKLTGVTNLACPLGFHLTDAYTCVAASLSMTEAEKEWLTAGVFKDLCNKAALNGISVRSQSPFTQYILTQ